ncbi:hypothetical protein TNCV_1379521 [Trichonephila clavipes]|nr:hypothetical protein TNCV_1379521 [Trichonephila clavipes]
MDGMEDDTVWENDDDCTNSEVSCDNGMDESFSKHNTNEEESMGISKEKPLTLDENLEKPIYSKTKVLYCSAKKSTSTIMKQEMQLLDSTENPSPNIIKLCEA